MDPPGKRHLLYLAPDREAQKTIAALCGPDATRWSERWGGWHITVGRCVPCDSVSGPEAVAAAASATQGGWQAASGELSNMPADDCTNMDKSWSPMLTCDCGCKFSFCGQMTIHM